MSSGFKRREWYEQSQLNDLNERVDRKHTVIVMEKLSLLYFGSWKSYHFYILGFSLLKLIHKSEGIEDCLGMPRVRCDCNCDFAIVLVGTEIK